MNSHMYHFKPLCSSSPATCDNFQRLERLLSLVGSSAKREHLAFAIPLPFSPRVLHRALHLPSAPVPCHQGSGTSGRGGTLGAEVAFHGFWFSPSSSLLVLIIGANERGWKTEQREITIPGVAQRGTSLVLCSGYS